MRDEPASLEEALVVLRRVTAERDQWQEAAARWAAELTEARQQLEVHREEQRMLLGLTNREGGRGW